VPEAIHDPHPQRAGEESIACSDNPENLAGVVTTGQKTSSGLSGATADDEKTALENPRIA